MAKRNKSSTAFAVAEPNKAQAALLAVEAHLELLEEWCAVPIDAFVPDSLVISGPATAKGKRIFESIALRVYRMTGAGEDQFNLVASARERATPYDSLYAVIGGLCMSADHPKLKHTKAFAKSAWDMLVAVGQDGDGPAVAVRLRYKLPEFLEHVRDEVDRVLQIKRWQKVA